MNVTIIGFGEAGPVFGGQFLNSGASVMAWDKRQSDPQTKEHQVKKTQALGIQAAASMQEAVTSANLIISTVTASQAVIAAEEASTSLQAGCHWLDLNSVSPESKQAVQKIVSAQDALFTEGVAMDTVPSKGAQVPILLCGPDSVPLSEKLNAIGMSTRSISENLGTASTTKLLRSILIKGMEALFAESMEAAGKVGMQDEVIASLQATYPGMDWQTAAGYQLSRATIHATRRAGEMREAEKLINQLGVTPLMTSAIAQRQQDLSDRNVASVFSSSAEPSIDDFIQAIKKV